LVIDDDLDGIEPIALMLRAAGYNTACASNGQSALEMLSTCKPDLLLLDLRMPSMDGISLLLVLRKYLRWAAIPVIVLTAVQFGPELERAKDLGVKKIFVKGTFRLDELLAAVKDHLPPSALLTS